MFICSSITAKLKGDDGHWFGRTRLNTEYVHGYVLERNVIVCAGDERSDDGFCSFSHNLYIYTHIDKTHSECAHQSETAISTSTS